MIYISRRVTFSAAHRLHNPSLSDAENKEIYGECNNPNGHGHNYTLEVTVKGNVSDQTGMVIDLKDLKKIVTENIINKVDHKFLNFDVDFMRDIIPTSENIVIQFWKILKDALSKEEAELYELKLHETENNIVVYRGD